MNHHTQAPSCPLCEEKLSQAHPDLAAWYRRVKPLWPDMHISWSFRDQPSQEQAFKDGKSKLHYPHSAHNKVDLFNKPCAEALDLFEIDESYLAKFNPSFYAAINAYNERNGFKVMWGGKWKTIGDADHFQLQP